MLGPTGNGPSAVIQVGASAPLIFNCNVISCLRLFLTARITNLNIFNLLTSKGVPNKLLPLIRNPPGNFPLIRESVQPVTTGKAIVCVILSWYVPKLYPGLTVHNCAI